MDRRIYILLFFLGLGLAGLVSLFQRTPGYMDAEYYFAGGRRLAERYGFTEVFLWNYLDDPAGLPHPSHTYWMPLASILAAIGMVIFNSTQFWAAKAPFLLIGGVIPPITAGLAYSISKRSDHGLMAGLLAVVPGFYLSYLGTTDTFGLYMLLGASWLQVAGWWEKKNGQADLVLWPFLLGIIAGIMHLARTDGFLWFLLGVALIGYCGLGGKRSLIVSREPSETSREGIRVGITSFFWLLFGYLLVLGFWLWRNLHLFQRPFPPGVERTLWLTNYDELYSFPADILTPGYWWASGLEAIIRERLIALGRNLESAWIVQGEIFLAPLILWGLWHWRRDVRVWMGMLVWGMTLLVMSFLFPFAGWRGGFFHSGAAIQPLFWAVVPSGLECFVTWGKRVRNWNVHQATPFFQTGIIGLAILLSLLAVQKRVIGTSFREPVWDKPLMNYLRLESALLEAGALPSDIVLVNNPPGYHIASGRPALAIPNGGEQTLLGVARRYGARYVLLEYDHPRGLEPLYQAPESRPGLEYLFDVNGTRVFRITP